MATNRIPEAAFFARTYLPSHVPAIVQAWRESLGKTHKKQADALASPVDFEHLFPEYAQALESEKAFLAERSRPQPSRAYAQAEVFQGTIYPRCPGGSPHMILDANGDAPVEEDDHQHEEEPVEEAAPAVPAAAPAPASPMPIATNSPRVANPSTPATPASPAAQQQQQPRTAAPAPTSSAIDDDAEFDELMNS